MAAATGRTASGSGWAGNGRDKVQHSDWSRGLRGGPAGWGARGRSVGAIAKKSQHRGWWLGRGANGRGVYRTKKSAAKKVGRCLRGACGHGLWSRPRKRWFVFARPRPTARPAVPRSAHTARDISHRYYSRTSQPLPGCHSHSHPVPPRSQRIRPATARDRPALRAPLISLFWHCFC